MISDLERAGEGFSPQELIDASDVVVFATLISEEPAPDGIEPEGLLHGSREAIVTKLKVLAVVAGVVDEETIEIVHDRHSGKGRRRPHAFPAKFRRDIQWPGIIAVDRPGQRLKYKVTDEDEIWPANYLVFAKARGDGLYELTTGKFQNGAASVHLFDFIFEAR